jgi:cyanophycin synthetase
MLTIHRTRILGGPNIWEPVPVIMVNVAIGELEGRLERETPVFFEPLIALLPSLEAHRAMVGNPELKVARLLLPEIALALQQRAGAMVHLAQTHPTDVPGEYSIVYDYQYGEVGAAAGSLAVRLLNHLLYGSEPAFDFAHELDETIIQPTKHHTAGPFIDTIVAAAKRRGIPVLQLTPTPPIVQLGTGAYQRRIAGSVPAQTTVLPSTIFSDTALTRRFLHDSRLPVPRSVVVRDVDAAVEAAGRLGYPVVLMESVSTQHPRPSLALESEAAVRTAFPGAAHEGDSGQVVVMRAAMGTSYRILVVGDQVVAMVEQVPAPPSDTGRRSRDEVVARATPDSELSPDHSTGGATIDRTDQIHPDTVQLACQAALVVGLEVAGIDIITPDIGQSIVEDGGVIVAVDPVPDLRLHTHPSEGTPRDVGMAIVDHLFPPGQPVRAPIVAVTGTNGKTTTTRMITHIMTTAGKKVGMTSTDGIMVNGLQLVSGDLAGAPEGRQVLRQPVIDFAVLETARGGILRDGLGFDRCDVAVVTNVAADHLGQDGINTVADIAKVKAVVPRAVVPEGASVLNADDPLTVAMAEVAGGEIVFFSMREDSPVVPAHLRQGGRAVMLRQTRAGEMLTMVADQVETEVLLVQEIPATMEGRIRVNIANALAATAAAIAHGLPLDPIRAALRTFANTVVQSPGRFNLLQIDGRQVVVDYCHNLHGLEGMADFIKRMDVAHTVAVIAMPGDRTDEHITAFGRLAAQIFDELVIWDTPAEYRRSRKPGEVPALLQTAAIAAGLAPEKISHSDDEQVAARMAIQKGRPGGLVVMLVGSGRSLLRTERSRHLQEGLT